MALCFRIPYADRWGSHVAVKWGESPEEALALLKSAHEIPGRGVADYGAPIPLDPQPFGFNEIIPARRADLSAIGPAKAEASGESGSAMFSPSEELILA